MKRKSLFTFIQNTILGKKIKQITALFPPNIKKTFSENSKTFEPKISPNSTCYKLRLQKCLITIETKSFSLIF